MTVYMHNLCVIRRNGWWVAKKVSIQIITLKLRNKQCHCQLRAITNNYRWKRVTLLSASFYIDLLNLCVF